MTQEELEAKLAELEKENKELQEKASVTAAFDPTKLTDEQVLKTLEDPRIWKTERLKSLRDKAKIAEDLEKERKEKEEEDARKKGDFEKLLNDQKAENEKLRESIKQEKITNAIQAAAVKAGAVDPSIVGKLIDRSSIVVAEDGTVSGVDEGVTGLLTASPYLKGKPANPVIGDPTNPGEGNETVKTFKQSQLNDTTFFREHEKEIDEAMKRGIPIEDDTQGATE